MNVESRNLGRVEAGEVAVAREGHNNNACNNNYRWLRFHCKRWLKILRIFLENSMNSANGTLIKTGAKAPKASCKHLRTTAISNG